MPSGLFGASGSGTASTPSLGTAQAYIPQGQQAADALTNQLLQNFGQQYLAGTTPAQVNYPVAESAALNVAQNPYAAPAQAAAGSVGGIGQSILDYLNQWTGQVSSPYFGQALQGAQTGAGYGGQAAATAAGLQPMLSSLPGTVAGLGGQTAGYAAPIAALAPQVAAGIAPLQGAASSILQTGYDPQRALYQRTLQQVTDQANAANAMYGLSASPYGAGLTNQALSNFNIDWQNQQLARQAQALGAAQGAYGQAGGLGTEAGGLYGAAGQDLARAAGLYGMAPGIAQQNLALGSGAANLAAGAGALPSQAYGQQWQQSLANLGGLSNLVPSALGFAGAPYTTSVGQSQAALPALTSATGLGASQYALPQQTLGDLGSYLGLGQSASQLSGLLGQQGVNQAYQGLGGLGALTGLTSPLLFGSQGLTGALGINPTTGLLGGLGGAGGAAGAGIDFSSDPAIADYLAATQGATAAGGGGGLLGLLGLTGK